MSMSIGAVASGGAGGLDLSMMTANLASRAKNQLDTNKDGLVSAQEELTYSYSHAVHRSSASTSSTQLGHNIDATA